jgi:hypothetical protein
MNYFGTDLDQPGHYFWELQGMSFIRSRINFNDCPFNPEALPYSDTKYIPQLGTVQFYNFVGFSICAIQGSCRDSRTGSKSIFFIKENLTSSEMKERILSIPIAVKMINQMPFKVKW